MWDFFSDISFRYDSIDVEIAGKKVKWFTNPYLVLNNFNGWEVEFIFIVKNEGIINEEWTKKPVPVFLTLKRGGKELIVSFVGVVDVCYVSEFDEFEGCVEIRSTNDNKIVMVDESGQTIFF